MTKASAMAMPVAMTLGIAMSIEPRPCACLRVHGHDVGLAVLVDSDFSKRDTGQTSNSCCWENVPTLDSKVWSAAARANMQAIAWLLVLTPLRRKQPQ